ncbi:MAG TPA: amidohydrolase family protein [Chthoniobacteraceae bacterium]|nr:amidohydrolase family protein [Chthoniobacteraceae bacterium]
MKPHPSFLPRVVDTHQHVFWHGRDDVGLIADMDEHGIDYAWLLSWEIHPLEHAPSYAPALNPTRVRPDGTLQGIPLEDLLRAKRHYPERFVLGFCPHPLTGDAPARLRSAASMYGATVCGEWKFRLPFDDPRCLELFRTAGELGMPVVLHLDVPYLRDADGKRQYCDRWYGGTVENLERALTACPETIFIGHAPGFWREISADADREPSSYPKGPVSAPGKLHHLLDRYENLYADLSAGSGRFAMSRDPEHAKVFLKTYASRLLFARDYYGGELDAFLKSIDLPEEVQAQIYYQNAERLVKPPTGCRG